MLRTASLLSVFLTPLAARTELRPQEDGAEAVRVVLAEVPADAPGCGLAFARDGRVAHAAGAGLASLELSTPAAADTAFRSVAFARHATAALTLLLAHEGRLSLTDPIGEHLAGFAHLEPQPSVAHLLAHSSGLRNVLVLLEARRRGEGTRSGPGAALAVVALQRAPMYEPGTTYRGDSASNELLLAAILEQAGGAPLRALAEERLFGPLGMGRTSFVDDPTEVVPGCAEAYVLADRTWRRHAYRSHLAGFDNLHTSAGDLARWGLELLEPRVLPADVARALLGEGTTPGDRDRGPLFALAARERGGARALELVHSRPGTTTAVRLLPEHGLVLTCVASQAETSALAALDALHARLVPEADFGGPIPADVIGIGGGQAEDRPVSSKSFDTDRLLGVYHLPELDLMLSIERRAGSTGTSGLYATVGDWGRTPVEVRRVMGQLCLELERPSARLALRRGVDGLAPSTLTLFGLESGYGALTGLVVERAE